MRLFEQLVLKDSIEIKTKPEIIWDFFTNLERNYKAWHPEDHILFRWTKGRPLEEGSTIYAEEVVNGKLLKFKLTCVEVVPNRKFVLKFPFPRSLFAKYEYRIEPKGSKSVFTALNYLKIPSFFKNRIQSLIEVGEKHVKEEGENLKRILEKG